MSKHHCRACGQGVCGPCSTHNKPVPSRGWDHPVRVCDSCHARTDSLWPFPPGKLLKVLSVFLRWATKHCESWHCCSLETRKGTKWQVWNQPFFYVKRELLRYVEGWPSGFHRSAGICFRSLLPSWATDFMSAVRWLTALLTNQNALTGEMGSWTCVLNWLLLRIKTFISTSYHYNSRAWTLNCTRGWSSMLINFSLHRPAPWFSVWICS